MNVATTSTRRLLWPCCSAARSASRHLATRAASSKTYQRPLREGEVPAYDEALAYIRQDQQEQLDSIRKLEAQIAKTEDVKAKSTLEEQIERLELASEINDPEIRWRHENGQADMSKKVYRYLAEEAWRRNGKLGILMQRVAQMNIVPDLLGGIDPDADLQVMLQDIEIEAGAFLKPEKTIEPPSVRVQVYHPETRLYTLLMLDPDSPHPDNDTFKTQVHWAVCNIPLSSSKDEIAGAGETILPYVPPHPQKGTPYHRYTFIVYEQESSLDQVPDEAALRKHDFDTRSFATAHSLKPAGLHFFRQIWDDTVTRIYNDVLRLPEPRFIRPKKL